MITSGKKKAMHSAGSTQVKLLSRQKSYKGKAYTDFVGSINVDGKMFIITIKKERGKDLIYQVKNPDGSPAKEKYSDSPLHVIYARVTQLMSY